MVHVFCFGRGEKITKFVLNLHFYQQHLKLLFFFFLISTPSSSFLIFVDLMDVKSYPSVFSVCFLIIYFEFLFCQTCCEAVKMLPGEARCSFSILEIEVNFVSLWMVKGQRREQCMAHLETWLLWELILDLGLERRGGIYRRKWGWRTFQVERRGLGKGIEL